MQYRDVTTSATRTIQNNFLDSSKQDAINLLLLGSKKRSVLDDVAYSLGLTNTMHGKRFVQIIFIWIKLDPLYLHWSRFPLIYEQSHGINYNFSYTD